LLHESSNGRAVNQSLKEDACMTADVLNNKPQQQQQQQ